MRRRVQAGGVGRFLRGGCQARRRDGGEPRRVRNFGDIHARIGRLAEAQLFFIGGAMKSGTTWLQLMLDAHPAVACKGESHLANHLSRLLTGSLAKHNQLLADKNATIFRELSGFPLYGGADLAYLTAAALLLGLAKDERDGLAAIGEKTPDNIRHLEMLRTIFPRAKFIHLVRDGRDCAVSGWFHNQRSSPEWIRGNFPTLGSYVDLVAREWAKDLAAAGEFADRNPEACLTLRYEDLVAETEGQLERVLDFLGVGADAARLAGCRAAGEFARLSGGRAPGEEDRGSFFRKGRPGDWRGHLDDALSGAFREISAPWLERFGYG